MDESVSECDQMRQDMLKIKQDLLRTIKELPPPPPSPGPQGERGPKGDPGLDSRIDVEKLEKQLKSISERVAELERIKPVTWDIIRKE